MALFSGAYLGSAAIAFVAPLAALLLSDLVLGFYHGMASVYATRRADRGDRLVGLVAPHAAADRRAPRLRAR